MSRLRTCERTCWVNATQLTVGRAAAGGDSGAIWLSYPDLTPVGMHTWSTTPTQSGEQDLGFIPLSDILKRIKKQTGISLSPYKDKICTW